MMNRRQFMQRTALAGGVAAITSAAASTLLSPRLLAQATYTGDGLSPGQPDTDYKPVIVPNGAKLPWKIVDGAKVFHLIAQEADHEVAPGLTIKGWGYNGLIHGPAFQAVAGDDVAISVQS